MTTLVEMTAMAAPLARSAVNVNVDHRELLAAAEGIIREIEAEFLLACFEIATIDDRLYTRVPGRDRIGAGDAWLVNGRVILDTRDKYLILETRKLAGADPFEVVEAMLHGASQVASPQQLQAFARDLPQILQRIVQDFPRRELVGDQAMVIKALRRAYHQGVILDWPAAGTTTRFSAAEREYRRKLRRQARVPSATEPNSHEK